MADYGSMSAADINASMGLTGAGYQDQALLNNIFGNFGQQTDYYSGLGAAYGRATGGFGGTIDANSFPDAGLANNPYYQAGMGGIGSDTAHDPYAWTLAQSSPYAEPHLPPSNGPYPNLGYNPGMANSFANPTMGGADQNTYGVDPGAWASMSAGDRATFNRAMGGGTSSQPYQGNPNYLPGPMAGQPPIQQAPDPAQGYPSGTGTGAAGAGGANVGNTYGTSGQNPSFGGGGMAPGYGGFQGGNNPYSIPANLLQQMSQSDIMQFNNMMAQQQGGGGYQNVSDGASAQRNQIAQQLMQQQNQPPIDMNAQQFKNLQTSPYYPDLYPSQNLGNGMYGRGDYSNMPLYTSPSWPASSPANIPGNSEYPRIPEVPIETPQQYYGGG
jgi:hypothetical protein